MKESVRCSGDSEEWKDIEAFDIKRYVDLLHGQLGNTHWVISTVSSPDTIHILWPKIISIIISHLSWKITQ